MQNAPGQPGRRFRRSVQQQRAHDHHSPTADRYRDFPAPVSGRERCRYRQATQAMGAWYNAQCPVLIIAIIQMKSNGNDVLQCRDGRLDE